MHDIGQHHELTGALNLSRYCFINVLIQNLCQLFMYRETWCTDYNILMESNFKEIQWRCRETCKYGAYMSGTLPAFQLKPQKQ